MSISSIEEYQRRYENHLQKIAQNLRVHIEESLEQVPNVERVTARAKHPDRFDEKASRKDDSGVPRYENPLTEIQDLIGARVIVFYGQNIEVVTESIRRYFQPIEQQELVPESEWAFGYFGLHFVIPLPRDVVPEKIDPSEVPGFFELQIKTLFQHAWSEANHEIGYKSPVNLSPDQQRRLAYTSAQAWGADRVFDELYSEIQHQGTVRSPV